MRHETRFALQRGESALERRRLLETAHESMLRENILKAPAAARAKLAASAGVRSVVFESWLRSLDQDINPQASVQGGQISAEELEFLRGSHPLAGMLPVIHRLLLPESEDAGFIVAVGDASGRLLWVDGDVRMRSKAEDIGFAAGMDWSEQNVGTSAPGSALTLGHSLQVFGAEHFHLNVHEWSCAAAPVRDPATGQVIGVIDITGGDEVAEPHVLPLVEATLAAVEAELKLEHLRNRYEEEKQRHTRSNTSAQKLSRPPLLRVLGRDRGLLESGSTRVEISRRHAEILLVLATNHPAGLSAAALAEQVYGDASFVKTLRPEIVRLRSVLANLGGDLTCESKPYRLSGELRTDANNLLGALDRGAHRLALAAYEGPLLPLSESPPVLELQATVAQTLREAMLQHAAAEVLYDYAERHAQDDEEVWETLLQVLAPLSPKRSRAVAHIEKLRGEAN